MRARQRVDDQRAASWFSGALARNGRYELKSFSGEVRVILAGNTGFEVDANSFSGDVAARPPDHDARHARATAAARRRR